MKGVAAAVALLITCAGVVFSNRTLSRAQRHMNPRLVGGSLLVTAMVFLFAWVINAPRLLQTTHPEVIAAKAANRQICLQALAREELLEAEAAIRNNTVGVALARQFSLKARQSLDRSMRRVNNFLFFNVGVLISVLPLMVAAGLACASTLPCLASWRLERFISPSDPSLQVMMPAINAATVVAVVAYVGFYFWLEEAQVSGCCLHSGHWYTYVLTTMASVGIQTHLTTSASEDSSMHRWYAGWAAAYQALAWRVLKTSQQFFHDDLESRQGILSALLLTPVVLGFGCMVACDTSSFKSKRASQQAAPDTVHSSPATAQLSTGEQDNDATKSAASATIPGANSGEACTSKPSPSAPAPSPPSPPAPPLAPPPAPPSTKKPAKHPSSAIGRDAMLQQIRDHAFKLKKVDNKEDDTAVDAAAITKPEPQEGTSGGLLRDAIEKRRAFIRQDSMQESDNWDDE